MGNDFHSLMTTARSRGRLALSLLCSSWGTPVTTATCRARIAGEPGYCTPNGERGSNVLGTIYERPPITSSAPDTLLREIQNARRTHSRLDTLIGSYAAQEVKTGLNNRLFSIIS
ncbi:hypothetical protein ACNKHU_20190 [Shigella flexneri]